MTLQPSSGFAKNNNNNNKNNEYVERKMSGADECAQFYGKIENFELGKKIGAGQFAEVFRAKCKPTGDVVALKKIQLSGTKSKKAQEDCLKEIDLLKQLEHENIIRYHASFIINRNQLYIVLEFADSGDLNDLILKFKNESRLLPERIIWTHFAQIMRALAFMHSKSIMHRDIKPANVFITSKGVVKMGDLGLGRFFSKQTRNAHTVVGTPYYMSPERIHEAGYDFKSDIWSVGCLLYEMAALQSPFYGEKTNLYALMKKMEKCEYPPLPANVYSTQMRALLSHCICSNPTERFDASQVLTVSEKMCEHFCYGGDRNAKNTRTRSPNATSASNIFSRRTKT